MLNKELQDLLKEYPDDMEIFSTKIGKYNLSIRDNGYLWIQKDDGEGMEITENNIVSFLDKFWQEMF